MNAQKYCSMLSHVIFNFKASRFQLLQNMKSLPNTNLSTCRHYPGNQPSKGSGAGRGGGAGGTVRESGGGMGKFAAANEEGYFYEKQKRQLKKIRGKKKKKHDDD